MVKVWQPIATAPAQVELELSIYDKGEYHALVFPCQRLVSRLPSLESLPLFCTECGSKALNSNGHQRRPLISLHSRNNRVPAESPSDQRMAANSGPMPLISSNIAAGAGAATCCAASVRCSRSRPLRIIFGIRWRRRGRFAVGDMKRIDPHHGLNGECQGAPSRHSMFRGSIPRGSEPRHGRPIRLN